MTVDGRLGLFLATFTSVFVAELGDKTQLATMALSGSADAANKRWVIFVGAACALISTSALGVLAGAALGRYLSPTLLTRIAGVLFVAMGAWMLIRAR